MPPRLRLHGPEQRLPGPPRHQEQRRPPARGGAPPHPDAEQEDPLHGGAGVARGARLQEGLFVQFKVSLLNLQGLCLSSEELQRLLQYYKIYYKIKCSRSLRSADL